MRKARNHSTRYPGGFIWQKGHFSSHDYYSFKNILKLLFLQTFQSPQSYGDQATILLMFMTTYSQNCVYAYVWYNGGDGGIRGMVKANNREIQY